MTGKLTITLRQCALVDRMLPTSTRFMLLHCLSYVNKFCSSSDDILSRGDQNIYEQNSSTSSAVRVYLCYEHKRVAICDAFSYV